VAILRQTQVVFSFELVPAPCKNLVILLSRQDLLSSNLAFTFPEVLLLLVMDRLLLLSLVLELMAACLVLWQVLVK